MDILLDTHVLLWYVAGDARLQPSHRILITDNAHPKFVSIASLWEIAIKTSAGKLAAVGPLDNLVPANIGILPVELAHLLRLQTLPYHHRDPFDRLLIAQALAENLAVISTDQHFAAYGVALL